MTHIKELMLADQPQAGGNIIKTIKQNKYLNIYFKKEK